MVFLVPHLKSPAVCEECIEAVLRDSVHTSIKNRSSVGYLLGLPVDIDSILVNGASVCLCVHHKCVLSVCCRREVYCFLLLSGPALRLHIDSSR